MNNFNIKPEEIYFINNNEHYDVEGFDEINIKKEIWHLILKVIFKIIYYGVIWFSYIAITIFMIIIFAPLYMFAFSKRKKYRKKFRFW